MTVRGLCAEFLRIMKYEIWQSFVLAAAGLTMISMEVLSCRRLADDRLLNTVDRMPASVLLTLRSRGVCFTALCSEARFGLFARSHWRCSAMP